MKGVSVPGDGRTKHTIVSTTMWGQDLYIHNYTCILYRYIYVIQLYIIYNTEASKCSRRRNRHTEYAAFVSTFSLFVVGHLNSKDTTQKVIHSRPPTPPTTHPQQWAGIAGGLACCDTSQFKPPSARQRVQALSGHDTRLTKKDFKLTN